MPTPSVIIFIYALCEPGTEIKRYIGKCTDLKLRLRQHLAEARRLDRKNHRCNWLRSLNGAKPEVVILEEVTQENWQNREKFWIAKYLQEGARLTNTTEGGEGLVNPSSEVRAKIGASKIGNKNCVGRVISEETRRLMSAANKGRQPSEETRARMSQFQMGRKHSEETKKRISLAHTGKKKSPESVAKSRLSRTGIAFSEEHKRKLSEAGKGKPKSLSHRAAIAAALRGKTRSVEHCIALSKAALARAENRRAEVQMENPTWHAAIYAQLRAVQGPLGVEQIWRGMEASGFQHASVMPRSTLGARIAELVQLKKLDRIGPAMYQLSSEPSLEATS